MIHRGGMGGGAARRTGRRASALLVLCAAPLALPSAGLLGAAEADTPPAIGTPPATASATAASLLADARAAAAAGRTDEARTLLARAADLDPRDPAIRAERARLATLAAASPPGSAAPGPVQVGWAQAEIRRARNRAEVMARAGRFEDAAEQLTVVRQNLVARRLDADATVADGLAELDRDLQRLDEQRAGAAAAAGSAERGALLDRARDRTEAERTGGEALRRERIRRITELRDHQHLELALAEARTLLDASGDDAEIRALYADLLAATHRQRRLTTEEQAIELRQELNERISRSLVPEGFDGMPIYPDGWAQRPRGNTAFATPPEPEWRTALRDALRTRVAVEADNQSGIEVLTALAAANHLNLVIDPALAAGAERTVSMHAPSMTLENAITWLCRQMGTSWSLTRGAVWIGTPIDDSESPLAIYDLAVITAGALDQPGKTLDLQAGGGGGGGGNNVGGGAAFDGGATFKTGTAETKPVTPEEVVDLIKASIAPEVWEKDGNGITIRGAQLYVTAPVPVHRLIAEFIRSQEEAHNLLVQVDTRWLTIEDDFLEEIGVDWNVGTSNMLSFPANSAGFTRQGPGYRVSGNTSMQMPASAAKRAAAASTQGLKLSWGYFGTVQLAAVLHAAENNLRTRILSAPSLTTINGVQSSLFIGDETAYISDYDVSAGNLDPKVTTLNTGIALEIRPFVSADRKYVTMEFRPALTSVTFFTDTITAARTAGDGPLDGPDGEPALASYPIQMPNLTVQEAGTTLTVPDRGSALIGGFTTAGDQTTESRVPFLGDLPYLGRLFGRRGRYSEHEKLYLLATLTIISYDEQEAKL